ncbi:hypothetical protein [Arhodomonas sp. AD133]|uniref:hypothetical protein n=1 Tax=Arhodomonas sp. AD133 TaxID=3415009 RepID=UPI003EB97C43
METPAPEQPNTPLMSKERFAQLTGVGEEVVRGWINKGYIPTMKIGRYPLINMEVLRRMCLEAEDWE